MFRPLARRRVVVTAFRIRAQRLHRQAPGSVKSAAEPAPRPPGRLSALSVAPAAVNGARICSAGKLTPSVGELPTVIASLPSALRPMSSRPLAESNPGGSGKASSAAAVANGEGRAYTLGPLSKRTTASSARWLSGVTIMPATMHSHWNSSRRCSTLAAVSGSAATSIPVLSGSAPAPPPARACGMAIGIGSPC